MKSLLFLALFTASCNGARAFTLPLPIGCSIVIPLARMDHCDWVHEHQHQEQIQRLGSSRFLKRIAEEYIEHGHKCGPLEYEAYAHEWVCRANNPNLTPEEIQFLVGCTPEQLTWNPNQ